MQTIQTAPNDIVSAGRLDTNASVTPAENARRSYPGGPAEDNNVFMAAELLATLVPIAQGDAKSIALRTVASLKEKVLDREPALLVQLNRAHGEKMPIKAPKVREGRSGYVAMVLFSVVDNFGADSKYQVLFLGVWMD